MYAYSNGTCDDEHIVSFDTSIGEIGTSQYFSTMKIGRNVKDTKNNVKSLVTPHYFSKMVALCQIPIGIRHYFCYLHRYVLSLNVINI